MEKIATTAGPRKIIKCLYSGEVDVDGLPHGKGEMDYIVERRPGDSFPQESNLRYKGEFVHGLRHGDGDLHCLGLINNPVSEYEWYSEGEYDSCGRFIHASNPPGSWQRCVKCWYPSFEGLWEDDMPLESRWEKGVKPKISKTHWEDIKKSAWEEVRGLV